MHEKIIILDFGSQTTQLIGRRIRELNTYCEILPYHELGAHKWALCGDDYKLKGVHPPPKETVQRVRSILEGYGKAVIV